MHCAACAQCAVMCSMPKLVVCVCSNPMAGTDTTLLGLAGAGYADGRSFGFAACERAVGASEGINLVMERRVPQPDSEVVPC